MEVTPLQNRPSALDNMSHKYAATNPAFNQGGGGTNGGRSPGFGTAESFQQDSIQTSPKKAGCRTPCEKYLCCFALFAILLIIAAIVVILLIWFGVIPTKNQQAAVKTSICDNKYCVQTAARITKYLDFSVNPCNNFYKYACGGWFKKNFLPHGGSSVATTISSAMLFFKAELTTGHKKNDIAAYKKARNYYTGCSNVQQKNTLGLKPVKDYVIANGGLSSTFGGSWTLSNLNLTELLLKVSPLHGNPFFKVGIAPNGKVMIGMTHLTIPAEFDDLPTDENDTNNKVYKAVHESFTGILTGLTGTSADSAKVAKLVNLYIKFQKVYFHSESVTQSMTLKDITTNFKSDKFDWGVFLQKYLPVNVDENFEFEVDLKDYFPQIGAAMDSAPDSELNDLVWVLFTYNYIAYLGEDQLQLDIRVILEKPMQQGDCIKLVSGQSGFKLAMESMYLKRFLPKRKDEKENIDQLVEDIRQGFVQNLGGLKWLDQTTKDKCIEKAKAMKKKILFPDLLSDDAAVDKYYGLATIDKDNFFQSAVNMAKFHTDKHLALLKTQVGSGTDKTDWGMTIFTQNAFYSPTHNEFAILAAIIESPFYEIQIPTYINYGSVGTIIGHEITHGFDDLGRKYDKDGNERPWWTPFAINAFNNEAQCFVEEYDKLTVEIPYQNRTLRVNGNQTLGENIADAGGLNAAFVAYKNYVKKTGEIKLLPGVPSNITTEMLFFISMAQTSCEKSDPDALAHIFQTDEHTPNEPRVQGTVMNSVDFAQAFKCPAGSTMNPTQKCKLW